MQPQAENNTQQLEKKRPRKLPAMPIYYGDWKKDLGVQSLDFFDRGVWFEMLGMMWESEERGYLILNGKPMTTETIARCLGLLKQNFEDSLQRIKEAGVCSITQDGTIYNRRMAREHQLSAIRAIAGAQGGNPSLLKQNASKTKEKNKANFKQTSVIENEIEIENEAKLILKEIVFPEKINTPEFRDAVERWVVHKRKNYDQVMGHSEIEALVLGISRNPEGAIDKILRSISNGWFAISENQAKNGKDPPRKFKTKTEQFQEEIEGIFKL